MKTLSATELRDLTPEMADRLARFELATPIECWEPGQWHRSITEGFITAHVIKDERGRESHMIGFHISPDNTFWVDLLIALDHPIPFARIEKVITGLAISKGAKCLRCSTARAGLAKWAQAAGWKPEMVVMTKVL